MSKQGFFKENIALVAGVALPVLLVLFFVIASVVPRYFVDPPKYDLVFSVREWREDSVSVSFEVVRGKLRAKLVKTDAGEGSHSSERLFVFDHETMSTKEITLEIPDDLEFAPDNTARIPVEGLVNATIDTNNIAPDGYSFENEHYYHNGLMSEFFIGGSGRYRYLPAISKNGATHKIPRTDNLYYHDFDFLGWIVGQKE